MTTRASPAPGGPPAVAAAPDWTPAATGEPPVAVEAGTLLATAPPGGGHLAGPGVVALPRPGGALELRAGRDGLPVHAGGRVAIAAAQDVEGSVNRASGDRELRGGLRIGGHVSAGRYVGATGPLRVAGIVERGTVRAGADLVVEGRASGASLEAGAVSELRRDLRAVLGGAPGDLDALAALTAQVHDAALARGAALNAGRVVATLRDQRFPGLADRLARAEAVLASARRAWPGLAPALALELSAARATVNDPARAAGAVARLATAAGFLAAATAVRPPPTPPGIRLGAGQGTRIACPGPLRVTGAGLVDCDADVGGDLVAVAPGAAIRGGRLRVGGRLRARELAGREGATLRIEMRDGRAGDDVVRADLAHPGVEIVVARETVRIDRRMRDLRVGIEGGRAVVAAR